MLGSTKRQELKVQLIDRYLKIFDREHVDSFILRLVEDTLDGKMVWIDCNKRAICSLKVTD